MSKTDLPFLPATQSEPLASAPPNCAVSSGSAVERQMRYLCAADSHLLELKNRVQSAKHWVRRRKPLYAAEEIMLLINHARKLDELLAEWDRHVIASPNVKISHDDRSA